MTRKNKPGAGRPATGDKTKYYTITLPIDFVNELQKEADLKGITINKYLRELVFEAYDKKNATAENPFTYTYSISGFSALAADNDDPGYSVDKKE